MKCFNCDKIISVDSDVKYCPFCGTLLDNKKEIFNNLSSLLVFIVEKYDEEILNSPNKMYAYVMDCKSDIDVKDIKLFKLAIDSGVLEQVYKAKKMNYDTNKITNMSMLCVKKLEDDTYISNENARYIINVIFESLLNVECFNDSDDNRIYHSNSDTVKNSIIEDTKQEKTEESKVVVNKNNNPIVTIIMEDGGIIRAELYPEIAPNTVNNFISLINKGFYNGVIFHRVIPGFMIQGGDPDGRGTGGPGYSIKGEFTANGFRNDLKHTVGVFSMARSMNPDSAGSQFFIMHENSPNLDGEYAAFGKVIEGQAVVDRIALTKTGWADKPIVPQVMKTVTVDTQGIYYPEPQIIGGESVTEKILFNGVYQCIESNHTWNYLRFFADGKVVEVCSEGTPRQVIRWFDHNFNNSGFYTLKNGIIKFDILSESGRVSYSGKVLKKMILLDSVSHINGHITRGAKYVFCPL